MIPHLTKHLCQLTSSLLILIPVNHRQKNVFSIEMSNSFLTRLWEAHVWNLILLTISVRSRYVKVDISTKIHIATFAKVSWNHSTRNIFRFPDDFFFLWLTMYFGAWINTPVYQAWYDHVSKHRNNFNANWLVQGDWCGASSYTVKRSPSCFRVIFFILNILIGLLWSSALWFEFLARGCWWLLL